MFTTANLENPIQDTPIPQQYRELIESQIEKYIDPNIKILRNRKNKKKNKKNKMIMDIIDTPLDLRDFGNNFEIFQKKHAYSNENSALQIKLIALNQEDCATGQLICL